MTSEDRTRQLLERALRQFMQALVNVARAEAVAGNAVYWKPSGDILEVCCDIRYWSKSTRNNLRKALRLAGGQVVVTTTSIKGAA